MDAKSTQDIEITHPNNVNLKLAFHKVASFHPHYLTFTPQTYHHPVRRSGHGLCRRHHKYECSQEVHTTIQTQSFAWKKQNNLLLNPDKTTCTLFTPDPAEYTSKLDLTINNKALPHGNAPKCSGSYLRPKTPIQHTHPQHLSTSTQTSTNHKSTHCNMMG